MSAIDGAHSGTDPAGLEEFPEFDLGYRFDDADDPGEVTLFSEVAADDVTTAWITIDVGHAVPLEGLR